MGLASTDWLMAAGWRQGLFMHCIEEGAPQPLPFNMQDPPGCYQSRDARNRLTWEFGWAYGVGWGAAIFLFGGVVLLMCDKESEEIYYKERKIVHDNDSRA
ncbi:p53-induced protein related [Holotrichia oblita]|uniref:P53-induced protein related n=2 Tax=Holotrichia oblita TaxID=644536 RepID=A0ACB9T0X8_HOLOL|nr:p53-induced protein related [Holotrichia oblita]KAI4460430.1 p53-induced protein related [Holotrichia oblita]